MKISEDNLVEVVSYGSWIILAILTIAGFIFASASFALSTLVGGLLAIGNFQWLKVIISNTLQLSTKSAKRVALAHYVLRLVAIALIAYVVTVQFGLSVIGLIVGLSVLLFSIIIASVFLLVLKGG